MIEKLKYHFRTTWRKLYIPVSLLIFFMLLFSLLFDTESFESFFDYFLGWLVLGILIVVPNIFLIDESIKDWYAD